MTKTAGKARNLHKKIVSLPALKTLSSDWVVSLIYDLPDVI